MRSRISLSLLCCAVVALPGCNRQSSSSSHAGAGEPAAKIDACSLLTKQEIEAIQGSPIKETKSSSNEGNGFVHSQCFYTASEFSKSVSLTVTRTDPTASVKGDVKSFWKETFGRYEESQKEREGDEEKRESLKEQAREKGEEEGANPPRKVDGLGDAAYWSSNRVGGVLYVLKGNAYIRVSLGGLFDEKTRMEKTEQLARNVLARL